MDSSSRDIVKRVGRSGLISEKRSKFSVQLSKQERKDLETFSKSRGYKNVRDCIMDYVYHGGDAYQTGYNTAMENARIKYRPFLTYVNMLQSGVLDENSKAEFVKEAMHYHESALANRNWS